MAAGPKPEFPPLLAPGFHVLARPELFSLTVEGFKTSATRHGLWDSLTKLCQELKGMGIAPCKLWIDGSFLTEKINPDDLDIILEVDESVYSKLQTAGIAFIDSLRYHPLRGHPRNLHIFFLLNCPLGHIDYHFFVDARGEWEQAFGYALVSKAPKGIAVLEIEP